MKSNANRELIALGAIVLSVCVGGWMMLVKPKSDALAKLDQQIAEHASLSASAVNQQSIQNAANRMASIKERLSEINEFNALADDSSRLYGLVMDMADKHQVQVQSLQPGATKQVSDDGKVVTTRLHMTVEGTYDRVAAFLESFCNLHAFIQPLDLEIMPTRTSDRAVVEANFGCDVKSFALTDALTQIGGANHGQP